MENMANLTEQTSCLNNHPLYLILWRDAQTDADWTEKDKTEEWAEKDCLVYEIGWIVKETKSHIVVCSQISKDGDLGTKTKIPIGMLIDKQKINAKVRSEWIK